MPTLCSPYQGLHLQEPSFQQHCPQDLELQQGNEDLSALLNFKYFGVTFLYIIILSCTPVHTSHNSIMHPCAYSVRYFGQHMQTSPLSLGNYEYTTRSKVYIARILHFTLNSSVGSLTLHCRPKPWKFL